MPSVAQRRLARLLGYGPQETLTSDELGHAADRERIRLATELVREALASDDVTSADAARLFVEERLAEWSDLLADDTRRAIGQTANEEIQRRAPDA